MAQPFTRHALADGTTPTTGAEHQGQRAAGFIKNGTILTVTAAGHDGSIRAHVHGGKTVTLPHDYVAQHVELGYAVTAHRCQGVTVDTTHTITTSRMTREAFYVAMTRGRLSNRSYIDTDPCHGDLDHMAGRDDTLTARTVLEQVLANRGAEESAHTLQARLTRALPTAAAQRRGPQRVAYDAGIAR